MEIDQRRREKLNEIQLGALQVQDPLQSVLRAAAGDLLLMSYKMNCLIAASLDNASDVSQVSDVTPAIDLSLKISRQADRFAQLDQRLIAAQRAHTENVQTAGAHTGIGDLDTHRTGFKDGDAARE